MKQHKFTVIVPTRERADTLYWTLKTLVTQDYENLEILVSDNFSQDNTKEIVMSFEDKRIKYINTGKRLSMSENWEFALANVQEGKLFYLGDDDGLLVGSISRLNSLLNELKCDCLAWDMAHYMWPGIDFPNKPNQLVIPLRYTIKEMDAQNVINEIYNGKLYYTNLLGLYKIGCVDVKQIRNIQSKYKKDFFASTIPDVSAATMLTRHIDRYWFSDYPLIISGGSKKSNTGSILSEKNKSAYQLFKSENRQQSIANLEMLHGILSLPVGEGLLCGAMEPDGSIKPKHKHSIMKYIIEHSLHDNAEIIDDLEIFNYNIERIRIMAAKNNMESFFEKVVGKYPFDGQNKAIKDSMNPSGYNSKTKVMYIDGDALKLQNIYDASVLTSQILGTNSHISKLYTYTPSLLHNFSRKINRLSEEILERLNYTKLSS